MIVLLFDIPLADPIAAIFIVAFIVRGAVSLLRDSGRILMEGAP